MYKLLATLLCGGALCEIQAAAVHHKQTVNKWPKKHKSANTTSGSADEISRHADAESDVDAPFDDDKVGNFRHKSGDIISRFTPYNDCAGNIVHMINHTGGKIYVMAYPLTCPRIIKALLRAADRGTKVRIILDKHYRARPQLEALKKHKNVKILVDVEPAIAHHKIMLYSNMKPGASGKWFKCAIHNGSFNFSQSAQLRNTENILILIDNELQYKSFHNNWKRRKHHPKTQTLSGTDYNSQPSKTVKHNLKKTTPRISYKAFYRDRSTIKTSSDR